MKTINIHHLLQHYGYFGVFLALFFEALGVPFPSETILVTSGIEMATKGSFSFLPLWLSGASGNIVGSIFAYSLGRILGRPLILRFGKYVGITDQKLTGVEKQFRKYEYPFLFIGKFIAFVRIVVPYLAGINKIKWIPFLIINAIAALSWSALFILLGNTFRSIWKHYHHILLTYWYLSIPLVLLLIAIGIFLKRLEHKKMNSA